MVVYDAPPGCGRGSERHHPSYRGTAATSAPSPPCGPLGKVPPRPSPPNARSLAV